MAGAAPLQFGVAEAGRAYADRPAAFGVAERDGRIALVRVSRAGEASYYDLPGGAIDPGETEIEALIREFGEETGLVVEAGDLLSRADQYMVKTDGQAVNNRSGLFLARVVGERPGLKIEDDHELVWMEPDAALRLLRHDSHAWAVARRLRGGGA
ncbi:DNA mismatch repair protein MutT [Caulobacter sp. CCUG 60055]|uniref:NUDIX domain-containing protein n=1 Tax=Caulobacter sp. CCUG 60055 TaxID=2100090 RepID=UPI001FA7E3D4|nr:NUDIX domain-containing protein [Caulobacter sp. CCUG 60055]MBQ1540894.1 NUDIX domain-containing protein [Caulobacteraceae bacterium]MCI3179198.1 DNA mismatch repair protein MutT [Caulobacter sp. CCUG 60055]